MGRDRAVLSKRNRYYIDRDTYYALLHHCRHYKKWRKEYRENIGLLRSPEQSTSSPESGHSDPTSAQAMRLEDLFEKIENIESAAKEAMPEAWTYLLDGVTEGLTYQDLEGRGMPYGRRAYYVRRRKFFWLMAQKENYI